MLVFEGRVINLYFDCTMWSVCLDLLIHKLLLHFYYKSFALIRELHFTFVYHAVKLSNPSKGNHAQKYFDILFQIVRELGELLHRCDYRSLPTLPWPS